MRKQFNGGINLTVVLFGYGFQLITKLFPDSHWDFNYKRFAITWITPNKYAFYIFQIRPEIHVWITYIQPKPIEED